MFAIRFEGGRLAAMPIHNAPEEKGWREIRWTAADREAAKFGSQSAAAAFALVYIPHREFTLVSIEAVG